MNISYKWLKEYVDFTLSAEEVSAALTSIGLEVEDTREVQSVKGGLKGLVVGEVLTCEPHPDSDHMHVCMVDVGGDSPQQIVCGAANVRAGLKVVVATIGTILYDGDKEFKIKKSKLRGIESYGMICAEDEIGVGSSHDGIIELPSDTPAGMPAAEYYELESDYLIEVDITPNRSDGASHYGVARDLYAWLKRNGYETSLHRPSVDTFKVDNTDLDIAVRVENAEACPRYCAVTVKGCDVKESPQWLKDKLTMIGLHPVNNIVDITNYVMMAYGQPLHCFDAAKITGKEVVVKTMPEGTEFATLDGEKRKLSSSDLVICNKETPMCIAGVLGGQGSGTYEDTCDVLFESAYFHPSWVRKSARRHGLNTDASFRFERGVDPEGQLYALKTAALMAKELAGGTISMEIKDVESGSLVKQFDVRLDFDYFRKIVGQELDLQTVRSILSTLEIDIVGEDAQGWELRVPAYRVDVRRACDVVEDILRIYGYNNIEIPTTISICQMEESEEDFSYAHQRLIAGQLEGQGFNEIMNNSLTKSSYYENSETCPASRLVGLMNPLSSDLGVLRQSLLFGGLESIARNVKRKSVNLRFFEFGNIYNFDASKRKSRQVEGDKAAHERCEGSNHLVAYTEEFHLSLFVTGKRNRATWNMSAEDTTIFDLKAYAESVVDRLGFDLSSCKMEQDQSDFYTQSLRYTDYRSGKVVYEFGIVAPTLLKQIGLSQNVYHADFNWDELMRVKRQHKVEFTPLMKYPAVSRDLALLVDGAVQFEDIVRLARKADKKYLKDITLFDVYEGKGLPEGKKSYAVNFILQDPASTMKDKQVDAIMKKIIGSLQHQLGATLR